MSQVEVRKEAEVREGVSFDPERILLKGIYGSELSAYRAKRNWLEALDGAFFLREEQDFEISIQHNEEANCYFLICCFTSTSARYAFWKLTSYQAPEAQYVIETGHIPICETYQDEIIAAPDLCSIHDEPLILSSKGLSEHGKWLDEMWTQAKKKLNISTAWEE